MRSRNSLSIVRHLLARVIARMSTSGRRERAIGRAYAKGYGKHPQEDWIGHAGLAALIELDRAEGGPPL